MKIAILVWLLTALINVQKTSAAEATLNPITRVVQLLQGLAKKVEADGKAEEELFEAYVCWYKTVMAAKEASNAAASARIEELEAYIADIEAGRIEFTSERTDLEAQIKDLHAELEEAEDVREKEHEDFLAAKDEMEKAIAALEKAVETLDEATLLQKDHHASMLSFRREVSKVEGEQRAENAVALERAVELGKNYLSKGDAAFLERVLSGEVPEYDWKKLNRKATFKMKYKARSTKILSMLKDMLQTFTDNLADATAKEEEAKKAYEALKKSKTEELEAAQKALNDMSKEGSARALSKDEAQQEVDDLKAQIQADSGFMADTQAAHKTKLEEWKKRKELRTGEIAAINEAIGILNSDEARDTMKKSFSSQGYLLLQKSIQRKRTQKAMAVLRQTGMAAKDSRLTSLARHLLEPEEQKEIDKVVTMIDEMIQTLKDEEKEDLKSKEECETNRMDQTKEARKASIEIDDASDAISREEAKIAEWKDQIKLKEEEIKKLEEDLKAATDARAEEKAEFEKNKADDEAAADLIEKAMGVLKTFYEENFSMLQAHGGANGIVVEAGKAPPPPPPTWSEPYGGAQGESKGIQAILQMILDDVKDDIAKAEEAEKAAVEAFEKFKTDTENSIKLAQETITDLETKVAGAEKVIVEQKTIKEDTLKTLKASIEEIQAAEPGCNFMTVNFEVRSKNRQLEIDGLLKAKAILTGGSFTEEPDPNREIKPGDAF